jgi:hypothetical protein
MRPLGANFGHYIGPDSRTGLNSSEFGQEFFVSRGEEFARRSLRPGRLEKNELPAMVSGKDNLRNTAVQIP